MEKNESLAAHKTGSKGVAFKKLLLFKKISAMSLLLLILLTTPTFAAQCLKCGKQLKWGFGTCAECKAKSIEQVKKAVDGSVNYCEECGKELKMGIGTCWECKQKKIQYVAEKAEVVTNKAVDNLSRGISETVATGISLYQEAHKPAWQKFIESSEGKAIMIGAGGILVLSSVISIALKSFGKGAQSS